MAQVVRVKDEPWPLPLLRAQGPELTPKLKDALAAYDAAAADPGASTESIAPIVRAALDPHVAIHEPGSQLLAHLTASHEAARVAVTKMARQTNWQYRFNALLCLGPSTPKDFAAELVRTLLGDSSSRVRGKAAEQALQLGLASLTEAVRQATATESSDTAIHALELSRDLMRDGYATRPARGGFFITVWTGSGTTGSWYSEADVAKRGLEAIVNDLRGTAEPG
jgi:hypothetical protein